LSVELLNEQADSYGVPTDGDAVHTPALLDADSQTWTALEASLAETDFDFPIDFSSDDEITLLSDDSLPANRAGGEDEDAFVSAEDELPDEPPADEDLDDEPEPKTELVEEQEEGAHGEEDVKDEDTEEE
ncbi:MAG: hypothetical protein FJ313_04410, partial [Gemmatimonadetes bacterium]|nr:hypothetical protein [Gemmatimonadota bacterium]